MVRADGLQRRIAIEQRRQVVEQGGKLEIVEQACIDDKGARPVGNQRGIGFDQPFDQIFG